MVLWPACLTVLLLKFLDEGDVKKFTTRLFTNQMAIFMTKKKVKHMVQVLYLVPFRQESGVSLQQIGLAQVYVRTVGWLPELDLK